MAREDRHDLRLARFPRQEYKKPQVRAEMTVYQALRLLEGTSSKEQ